MPNRWQLSSLLVLSFLLQAQPSFSTLAKEAAAARDANHLDEAQTLYRKALAIQPTWAEGWFSLGTIEYDQSLYKDAASAFTNVVGLTPKEGTSQIMLGLCEFELGLEDSALHHLQEGRRIGIPDNPQLRNVALFHEGLILQRSAKFDAAQEVLYSLCLAGVDNNQVSQVLGMIALRLPDRTPPASAVIQQVGHAECLAGQKKFDDARREYQSVVQNSPNIPDIHLAHGRFLLAAHDIPAAIAEFKQEIKNQPASAIAYLQIAAAEYRVDSASALPYAEQGVKLDPTLPLGHYLLGLLLLEIGDNLRAIPELEAAQKSLTREPGVYYALGSAYAQAGRKQDAARARATFQSLRNDVSTVPLPPN